MYIKPEEGTFPLMNSVVRCILLILILAVPAGTRSQTPDVQAKFRLAQGLEQAGEHERAAELYRELLQRDPQNYAFFDGVHRTAMQLKRYEDAIAVIRARITFFPADVTLHGMLGTAHYRAGQDREAMEVWDRALSLAPANPQTYRIVATVLAENRLLDRAADAYRRGRVACKDPALYTLELAHLLSATMDYAGATREYIGWLRSNPNQISFVQSRMGAFTLKEEGRAAAIAVVREAAGTGRDFRLHELLGWLYMEGKEFDRAFAVYRQIDELSAARGGVILDFAERAYREQAYAVADAAYREALGRDLPEQRVPQARYGAACAAMELQMVHDSSTFAAAATLPASESRTRFAGPLAAFEGIAASYPNTEYAARALYQSGTIHLRQFFDLDRALETFRTVLDVQGAKPVLRTDVRLRMGEIQLARADTVAAVREFRAVASLPAATPDQADEALLSLAWIAFFNGRLEESMGLLDSISLNIRNDHANDALDLRALLEENMAQAPAALALFGRAEFLARQRKNSEAIGVLTDLVGRFPRVALVDDALLRAAALSARAGLYDSAIAAYDRLLTEFREQCRVPDRALFLRAAVLQFGKRQPAEAAAGYERLLIEHPSSVFAGEARKRIRQLRGDTL